MSEILVSAELSCVTGRFFRGKNQSRANNFRGVDRVILLDYWNFEGEFCSNAFSVDLFFVFTCRVKKKLYWETQRTVVSYHCLFVLEEV